MVGMVIDPHRCTIRGQILAVEGKKKEKKTKFLTRLRSKRENLQPQPQSQSADSRAELLDIIRLQMEVSCNFPLNYGVPTLGFSANCTL